MQTQIDTTQRHLGELASMAHQTEETERRILAQAEKRLAEVQMEIMGMHASGDHEAEDNGEKYMNLVQEQGQLNQVIARARQALSA